MNSPFAIRRLPQDREQPPLWSQGEGIRWRVAYARAAESQKHNEVGQDVVALGPAPRRLSFALADGVSQSFFGDLAATALGERLARWCLKRKPAEAIDDLHLQLELELENLRSEVAEDVRLFPLPSGLPPMLREVLEQKRLLGSESMFVAGSFWAPGQELPEGRLLLCWLGDMRCRWWSSGGEQPVPGRFHTADRWSSQRGCLGVPQLYLGPAPRTLLVYSDGLACLDALAQPPESDQLEGAMASSLSSPTSDDISYLEISASEEF